MKPVILLGIALAVLCASVACTTPVLRKDALDQGERNVSPTQIVNNPAEYMGRLFVVGGIIAGISVGSDGTTIEALYVPVDKNGYFQETDQSLGRFLAFYPREKGVLDPLMYREGRKISLAGRLDDIRSGKIGEMPYTFPFFTVQEIYLWTSISPRSYPPAGFFSFGVLFGM